MIRKRYRRHVRVVVPRLREAHPSVCQFAARGQRPDAIELFAGKCHEHFAFRTHVYDVPDHGGSIGTDLSRVVFVKADCDRRLAADRFIENPTKLQPASPTAGWVAPPCRSAFAHSVAFGPIAPQLNVSSTQRVGVQAFSGAWRTLPGSTRSVESTVRCESVPLRDCRARSVGRKD